MSHILRWILLVVGIAVSCKAQKEGDIRFINTESTSTGRLQIFLNHRWGGVCDTDFDNAARTVACRQLSLDDPLSSSQPAPIAFQLLTSGCTGHEDQLKDCSFKDVFNLEETICESGQVVTLDCRPQVSLIADEMLSDDNDTNSTTGTTTTILTHPTTTPIVKATSPPNLVNPCLQQRCLNGGVCRPQANGSFSCGCPNTYHGFLCEQDTNECQINNGGCSHICVNTDGSHYCKCPDSEMKLGGDNHTCLPRGLGVTCGGQAMQVEIDKRIFHGIHASYLSLRSTTNGTCTPQETGDHVIFTIPLEGCGTTSKQIGDAFVYENHIASHPLPLQGLVTRVRDVNVTIQCYYRMNNLAENFYIVDTGQLHFTDHNKGIYQIHMDLIHNGVKFNPTSGLPLKVEPGEKLSVKLSLQTNDTDLQVFARNCKATPTSTPQSTQQYLVIDNGCSTDTTLTFKNASTLKQETVTLETFKFLDNTSTIYFHCDVLVCNASDPNSRCHQGCLTPGRGRRDARQRTEGPYILSHHLSAGPVEIQNPKEGVKRTRKSEHPDAHIKPNSETWRSTMTAGLALLGVSLIMITIALSIVVKGDEEEVNEEVKDEAAESLLSRVDTE